MLQPIGEIVLVKPFEMEKVMESGLFVVSDREPVKRGEVISVGSGEINKTTGHRAPLQVKQGDTILFHNYSGTEIQFEGEDLRLIREAEILAIEEPEVTMPKHGIGSGKDGKWF